MKVRLWTAIRTARNARRMHRVCDLCRTRKLLASGRHRTDVTTDFTEAMKHRTGTE
jgi:hypothetical protein